MRDQAGSPVAVSNSILPHHRLLAISLMLGLFLVGAVNSPVQGNEPTDGWSPAENLSRTELPAHSIHGTLAQDPTTGDLFAVWTDDTPSDLGEIMGRRWDRASQSWLPNPSLPADNLSQSPGVTDQGPMIHFEGDGLGHLLWTRRWSAPASATELMWRTWDGEAWSPEVMLLHTDSHYPGNYGLIPVETPDALLLFVTFDTGYRTAEYQDGSWSEFSPWTYLDVKLAQILRDDSGLMHAAAFGENSSQWEWDRWFLDAYYLAYDGAEWTEALNLSWTLGVAQDVDLALDGQGRLHFLWSDPNSVYSSESFKSAIWERVYDGSSWTINTEITPYEPDQAINGFSLATDLSGTLHLAWSEGVMVDNAHTDLDLYYQQGDGTTWGFQETIHLSMLDSRYPVLTVGDEGAALVWAAGPVTDQDVYFSRQVEAAPCQGLSEVSIEGPLTGTVGAMQVFTATSSPFTATWPVTYTWQADGQPPVTHIGGFVDQMGLTWNITGTMALTVTAKNCGRAVTDTQAITIEAKKPVFSYLPLVRQEGLP
jgi:hypothetical protein